ncbi:NPCBM/NEW2 domain-containing protein [Deinococcus pimensis]|uniref:NPCBM/NEW2 domain-containing protein n=1 Tax=Deinococcus pimensis TaxID=309888 RepID=UPI0004B640BF|nr:NPCBM/NEW2 domain-containing protein [Deinococcus pimensis]
MHERSANRSNRTALPAGIVALTLLLASCGTTTVPTTPEHASAPGAQTPDVNVTVAALAGDLVSTSLSNEPFTASTNAWGPVERNRSNGEQAAGDGRAITLNGATYTQGFGTHAGSSMTFNLGGKCATFTSDIGVDDEVGKSGSVVFQVFADGAKVFDSGVMTGASATRKINVSVAGKQELKLVVTDAGNGNVSDHADWAGPTLSGCDITRPLGGLALAASTNAWGPVEKDRSNGEQAAGDGRAITLNGATYTQGFGTHAGSSMTFNLGGRYGTFRSDVGVDDEVGNAGSVVFQVFADGAKVFDSGTMTGASATKQVNVSVAGKQELKLVVTDAGDGNAYDHADWAAPTLLTSGTVLDSAPAPVAVSVPTPTVTDVTVAPATLALTTGQSGTLAATVSVTGGAAQTVSWTSSNAAVATVDASGKVTAVGAGTATVTATSTVDGARKAAATVSVTTPAPAPAPAPAPTPAPAPAPTTVTYSGPIVITKGGTYSGNWESKDPNVATIEIKTQEPVVIEKSNLRGGARLITGFYANLTVRDSTFTGVNPNVYGKAKGYAIGLGNVVNLRVENNTFDQTGGIYLNWFNGNAAAGQTIKILRNKFRNIDGRLSNGQGGWLDGGGNYESAREVRNAVMFNSVRRLPNAEIAWNEVVNEPGNSLVEDNINMYTSSGTADSPILIHDNYIQGAYPIQPALETWYAGGGILLGDGSTTNPDDHGHARVYNNQVVSTTNYGLSIMGGVDNQVYNNRALSSGRLPDGRRIPSTNGGMILWDYAKVAGMTPPTFGMNVMRDNTLGWTRVNADGSIYNNPMWTPDCATNGTQCANNANLGTVTVTMEQAEFARWKDKLSTSGVTVGPR